MLKPRRDKPRRRTAPRWSASEWQQANQTLYQRSKGKCEVCGKWLYGDAERHHRRRRRDGGDRFSNILLIHSACHRKIHMNPTWARAHGYSLIAGEDPLLIPVWYDGHSILLLDDDGGTCTM